MDVITLDVEREAAPIHPLVMLERGKANALRQSRNIVEDLCTVHRVLNVALIVLALKRCGVLLKQTLIEF